MPSFLLLQGVLADLTGTSPARDDVVIAAFRYCPVAYDRLHLTAPARASELAGLRRQIRTWLAERGVNSGSIGLIATHGTLKAGFFQNRFAARGLGCITSSREDLAQLVLPAIACVKANDLDRAHQLAGKSGGKPACCRCPCRGAGLHRNAAGGGTRTLFQCRIRIDATRALARGCVVWHRAASAQAKHL